MLRRALIFLGVGYVLLVGLIFLLQGRLLYLPTQTDLPHVLASSERAGLAAWPGAADYRGLVAEPAGEVRGTAILFHGNAGFAGHRLFYAEILTRRGLRVILAEYPGYGPRPGVRSEAVLVEDARQTIRRAREMYVGPLILVGESLGSGVAAAASRESPVDALLLITPWDKLEHVARYHLPWVPVGPLLRERYESALHLSAYTGRIAIVLAGNDIVVPARFGHALFEQLTGPKRLWVVAGAGHNDWPQHVDDAWWDEIIAYLLAVSAPS